MDISNKVPVPSKSDVGSSGLALNNETSDATGYVYKKNLKNKLSPVFNPDQHPLTLFVYSEIGEASTLLDGDMYTGMGEAIRVP